MAILKCKMCGGDLNVTADEKIVECEFCGTTQTIPDGSDERKTNLFNRANRLRIANEFDKAAGIYESIIAEIPDEAESYWGLCLCKFGIEYVDDPKTAKKIPTCHRTSFESIFDDENYKAAIEKSDVVAQGVYKEEATVIDNLQKDILSIVHKEEPFDVFICYKETDDLGQRTQDSVLAQDIYYALIDKGFKVFFSRITLEDKLGKQYEPYIFAALNSAKVMLAIGTKEEYYNAVWVKNEWSRFLALMEKDKEKMLIPCYRDIDPYDMPQEFKNLQGQDMSKLGFLQDLVRGITKIINPEQEKQVQPESTAPTTTNGNVKALLERGFMALEDSEWKKADEFFEQALNFDAKLAEAYLGKLMTELYVREQEDLKICRTPFGDKNNYKKAIRFANESLKKELEGYLESCIESCIEGEEKERKAIIEKHMPYYVKGLQTFISAGSYHTVGLRADGTVVAVGCNRDGQCNVEAWKDIIAISAGSDHTVGLKADGTVVAVGDNKEGQCNVEEWKDIIAISAGSDHTVGLKADGTVVAVGTNDEDEDEDEEYNVEEWKDIVAICSYLGTTVGLKVDGTVVGKKYLVEKWKNIVAISAGGDFFGLRSDGGVNANGNNLYGNCDVLSWRDIIAISAGSCHTVGLKKDGTVVATNIKSSTIRGQTFDFNDGQSDVLSWRDIVAISAGDRHTVGLKADGTVITTGSNNHGQCNVREWKNIALPIEAENREEFLEKYINRMTEEKKKTELKRQTEERRKQDAEKIRQEEQRRLEEERRKQEEEKRRMEEERRKERDRQMALYRSSGLCQHCGGELKGLFVKKCVSCGKKKDY